MRLRSRTDANGREVMRAFRQCGAHVLDLSKVGGGCADLLISVGLSICFVEIKTATGKLNKAQQAFHAAWPTLTIRSAEEAPVIVAGLRLRNLVQDNALKLGVSARASGMAAE